MEQRDGRSGPPLAPEIARRLQFDRLQRVAMPLMLVVPVLAAAGRLGGTRERAEARGEDVAIAVDYSPRDHADDHNRLMVSIHNHASAPLQAAHAEFSRTLVDDLWDAGFQPGLAHVDEDWYVVALGEIPPHAGRVITLDYRPGEAGRLTGDIRVRSGDAELVRLPLVMVVLP